MVKAYDSSHNKKDRRICHLVPHLRVYSPSEALIRKYLEFTINVVRRIKRNGVPDNSIEIVKNCAAPANTKRDIKVRVKSERPAFLARSP